MYRNIWYTIYNFKIVCGIDEYIIYILCVSIFIHLFIYSNFYNGNYKVKMIAFHLKNELFDMVSPKNDFI